MKAVTLMSGGQDSTTCLAWALKQYGKGEVAAITFDYGQTHDTEIAASKEICRLLNVRQVVIRLDFLPDITSSALLKNSDTTFAEKDMPATFVPNRNQLFITIAHAYAQKEGAGHLIVGACDADVYPDNKRGYIAAIEKASNLGSGADIRIDTPLIFADKARVFAMAEELGVLDIVLKQSRTCYKGEDTLHEWGMGCGECTACKARAKGFREYVQEKYQGGLYH